LKKTTRPKENNESKRRKNKGKLIFLRRNAFTEGSEKKMLRLFMKRNCGRLRQEKEKFKRKIKDREESEGKEETKKHNANK
jgi:hypothetical protein